MTKITTKVEERIKHGLKKYQRILRKVQARDINESDTRIIVNDILCDLFGYDKYNEITTEYAIRGTYSDLAIKSGDDLFFLIEVKAIGKDLKDAHLKQALDYAVNAGVDWVVLTNAVEWHIYKVIFKKPISKEQLFNINLLEVSSRDSKVIEMLFLLSKEGLKKAAITEFQEEKHATNRFIIAALIQSEPVLKTLRREIRNIYSGVKIDKENLRDVIRNEVLKRDAIEGDKAKKAEKKIRRVDQKAKQKKKKEEAIEKLVKNDGDDETPQ